MCYVRLAIRQALWSKMNAAQKHDALIPPLRFAMVETSVFRGAYPTLKNYRFLRR